MIKLDRIEQNRRHQVSGTNDISAMFEVYPIQSGHVMRCHRLGARWGKQISN